jgi:hypothetical protein
MFVYLSPEAQSLQAVSETLVNLKFKDFDWVNGDLQAKERKLAKTAFRQLKTELSTQNQVIAACRSLLAEASASSFLFVFREFNQVFHLSFRDIFMPSLAKLLPKDTADLVIKRVQILASLEISSVEIGLYLKRVEAELTESSDELQHLTSVFTELTKIEVSHQLRIANSCRRKIVNLTRELKVVDKSKNIHQLIEKLAKIPKISQPLAEIAHVS